ncbi:hypothetical protein G9F32_09985 [Acinetobacter sp. 194]|uniref:hypothetical protein n=1 Tax=Acinetobacter shaoyimingii TaxID=2715164 RepID=UPI0014099C68|nr:hypothetical protein [Acinetobacter shaoyimingii]NHB58344.1 hypothetical protein [Acinetobacter shaoyimingii]
MNQKIIVLNKDNKTSRFNKSSITANSPLRSIQFAPSASSLNAESHIFIVVLGALIGAAIAFAIGYSISANWLEYGLLMLIPLVITYFLRKVYIYTLLNFKE